MDRERSAWIPAALAAMVVAACGGAGLTPAAGTGSMSAPVATPAPSPTAHAPGQVVVWAAESPNGLSVRVGTSVGTFRQVTRVPSPEARGLGAGGHRLLFEDLATGHVYDADTTTGTVTDHGGGPGFSFYGGAFSADGQRVQYTRQTQPNTGELRVLDFGSGAITPVHSFSANPLDVPKVWSSKGVAALRDHEPNADSPQEGFALLDPGSGDRIGTTTAGTLSTAIGPDGVHAALTQYQPLGETSFMGVTANTLATVDIGSPPTVVLQEKDHDLRVLAVSPDGSTVLYSDTPASHAGGADVTQSPDYGLFTLRAGTRTRHAPDDGAALVSGVFVDATDFLVLSVKDGTAMALSRSTAGGPLVTWDIAAGNGGSVYLMSGSGA